MESEDRKNKRIKRYAQRKQERQLYDDARYKHRIVPSKKRYDRAKEKKLREELEHDND